jgi:hypothetical protein
MNRHLKAAMAAILLAVPAAAVHSGAADAAILKEFEFNVDGVLPSADAQISLANNTGHAEATIYAVSGGVLQQRTYSVNGNASYSYPSTSLTGGGIDPNQSFSMEARLRILQIEGSTGAYYQAFAGSHRYRFAFTETGIQLLTNNPGLFYDIAFDTSEFHTYRLDSDGAGSGGFDFFIDGALAYSGTAYTSSGLNGFNFGDGITDPGAGADVDWDFVRFSQPAYETALPEPGALAVLSAGLFALAFARRRRAGGAGIL